MFSIVSAHQHEIVQLQPSLASEMNIGQVSKPDPETSQTTQQQITIHQLPISNTGISYAQMPNQTSFTSSPNHQIVIGNSSKVVHQTSTNVNPISSIQNTSMAITTSTTGAIALSESSHRGQKPEYSVPKTEYS